MSTFFTSDTHFGHKNIIKYENRPFNSVEEMDICLINKWNQKVKQNDDIYILGDFCFGDGNRANELLRQLNGRKYLIKGNHDSFLKDNKFDNSLFEWVKDYYVLKTKETRLVLFHYPIQVWAEQHYGSIHCYGHIHSNEGTSHPMKYDIVNSFNVGVDINNLEPVSIEDIIAKRKEV